MVSSAVSLGTRVRTAGRLYSTKRPEASRMIGFLAPFRPARGRRSLARWLRQKRSEIVSGEAAMRRSILCTVVVAFLAVLLEGFTGSGTAQEPRSPAPRFVREAQRTLRALGYHPGPVDGVLGPKTKDALARYQRSE